MTNNQHGQAPEALRLAEEISNLVCSSEAAAKTIAAAADELCRQHARIAELESELEAIGAGGVTGPLMGRASLQSPGFDAADMATASARGFRDGVASIAANAGEPAAYLIDWPDEPELGHYFSESSTETGRCRPLYLAAPPAAQAEGWTKASKQLPPCREDQLYIGINTAGFAGVFNAVRVVNGNTYCLMEAAEESVSIMSDLAIWKPFNPPTSAEGVDHG